MLKNETKKVISIGHHWLDDDICPSFKLDTKRYWKCSSNQQCPRVPTFSGSVLCYFFYFFLRFIFNSRNWFCFPKHFIFITFNIFWDVFWVCGILNCKFFLFTVLFSKCCWDLWYCFASIDMFGVICTLGAPYRWGGDRTERKLVVKDLCPLLTVKNNFHSFWTKLL